MRVLKENECHKISAGEQLLPREIAILALGVFIGNMLPSITTIIMFGIPVVVAAFGIVLYQKQKVE